MQALCAGQIPAEAIAAIAEAQGDEEDEPQADDEMGGKMAELSKAIAEDGLVENDCCEVICESDEDLEEITAALGLPQGLPVYKVKSFHLRDAWKILEAKGLTDLPRHIKGCSISYHSGEQRWQAIYPGSTVGMSTSWGRSTKRSECEALLRTIRNVLEAHCSAHPRDSMWATQLKKVTTAEAKGI